MNKNFNKAYVVIIALAVISLLLGCANYGKVRPAGLETSIETLAENWVNYDVYWTGISKGEPTAILFDPKDHDRSLEGDIWYKVEDAESLASLIGWIEANREFYPSMWRVLGPDGEFYGYLYSGSKRTVVRAMDEKTLWVSGIPATLRGGPHRFTE
jgi:hypothetical protein